MCVELSRRASGAVLPDPVGSLNPGAQIVQRTLDQIAQSIIADAPSSTLQRAIDRHIQEIDYWLKTRGYRLQILSDALTSAGYRRKNGEALTWPQLGPIVSRARQRAAKQARAQSRAASSATPSPRLDPPAATASSTPPHAPDIPLRTRRGLEALAINRKKEEPNGLA